MINVNESFAKIEKYASEKYLEYSIATLKDRAIPYLNDGLKPVHRRILYAMNVMGIRDGIHKKSARIVGDVIGKYHPHGDTAVYQAMVRMSQEWLMRYPIVSGQGNFGSRDGDGAAAMRYTESSLTAYAEHILLSELKEGTSEYIPNYDGTMEEVRLFSSRLNNLLLNGSTGIAVGMATNIPSHNIRELTNATLAYIDNNDITVAEIMEHLKGPDFASAGQIISSKKTILNAYETGQGKIRVRVRWRVEKLARGQWHVVVYELPPNCSIEKIRMAVDKITNPPITKDKNGKAKQLSNKVIQDKNFLTKILEKAHNDSDKKVGDRLVLVPKSSKQDPDEFMNSLIPMLELEETFGVNLVSVGDNGRPELKNIKTMISEWVSYRLRMIIKRIEFHLKKTQKRIHIVEGRIKVYENLDRAIEIIRGSKDAKLDLIESFNITEAQAEDILEIKLRQLANLEKDRLESELDKLKKEEEKYTKLLSSETRLYSLMKKEIELDTVKFEDERRTLIEEAETVVLTKLDKVIEEPITIIYTKDGWLTQRKGHNIEIDTLLLKQGDSILQKFECKSIDNMALISSDGRSYTIKSIEIPNGKNFIHINSLLDLKGASVIDVIIPKDGEKRLFSNSGGYGFISETMNLISKGKAGKHFMSLSDGDEIFKSLIFNEDLNRVNVISTDNRLLSFPISEMKELEKGKGVQIIKLVDNNKIKDISISMDDIIEYYINSNRSFKNDELEKLKGKRAQRGKVISENIKLLKY